LGKWLKNYIIPGGSQYNPKIWKDTKPGEVELYSNIGAALLGFLVESVSGKDFNTYCIENIFLPLDMPNTSFRIFGLDKEKMAMPYYENLTPCGNYSVPFYPSTTIKSSIAEFSHFLIAMMNGGVYKGKRVLKERTVKEILKVQYANSWSGLLWWKYRGDWYGGQGGFLGSSTTMAFKKDKSIGILIFSNRTEFNSFYPPDGQIFTLIKNKAETFF
jgi:CubicO group peptidase (beta-lactamase class C family)